MSARVSIVSSVTITGPHGSQIRVINPFPAMSVIKPLLGKMRCIGMRECTDGRPVNQYLLLLSMLTCLALQHSPRRVSMLSLSLH